MREPDDAGSVEAILLKDGYAVEGAASNVFIVTNGVLVTPPNGPDLLPGITRDLVVELARAYDIPVRETGIPESDLRGADEIWLTSSTREISPVTTLDAQRVGGGEPGPLWKTLIGLFQDYKERVRCGQAG